MSSGKVTYGADNAFGNTSELELAAGTKVDMNGKTQTGDSHFIGGLTMTGAGAELLINGGSWKCSLRRPLRQYGGPGKCFRQARSHGSRRSGQ